MNSILIYLLQSAISLVIFYLFYELLFKRDAFFAFNRYYLLLTIFISTLLPLLDFSMYNVFSGTSDPVISLAPIYGLFEYTLGEVTIYGEGSSAIDSVATGRSLPYFSYIILLYLIGVFFAVGRFALRFYQISRLLQKSKVVYHNGLRLIFTVPGTPTFSFFNYVFIDENLFNRRDEVEKIIEHEKIHIDQKHSLDLVIAELFSIIQWFNPIVYLLKKTLKENHEFIADSDVLTVYPDIMSYTKLLIDNSSIIKTNILTHNFSYSLLKRRLFMIKKTKNPLRFSFKLVWVLLAVSMVVFACSGPIQKESISSDVEFVSDVELNIHPDSIQIASIFEPDKNYIKFIVSLGKERDTKIKLYGENGNLIKVFMEGVHARGAYMVTWHPENGETIPEGNYRYTFFADDNKVDGLFSFTNNYSNAKPNDANVFTVVEVMPEYPGGMDELFTYLVNNINYPDEAKVKGVQGRVFVNFVVGKDGSVYDAKVLRGIGGGCDEEAIRVVEAMPNWIPGKQRGQNVNVSYNIPINFVFDEKDADTIFTVVEVMPSFPGGKDKLMTYLSENIKYPNEAKKNSIEGRVFVSFVVEKDGSIGDVKILRGIGSGCDEESIRVIENMPRWTPGTQRGQAVRVAYNLPIRFKLS
ncbi:MAG: M56 family metallopeptidase [Bacteroidetes bacterium]|nr:M56 family metallopeptidase [Bacteroidota bacterium]